MLIKKLFLLLLLSLLAQSLPAQQAPSHAQTRDPAISLQLNNVPLVDAIRVLTKFLHIDVIINPAIQGFATVQLQHAQPEHALRLLLNAHGLAKWQQANVWYIGFRDELVKRKEEQLKWREIKASSQPHAFKVWQIQYGNANDIARLLKGDQGSVLSKDGNLRIDKRTNRIFILDTPNKIKSVDTLIRNLDIPVPQVLIEARVVSIDYDCEQELGLDFVTNMPSAIRSKYEAKNREGQFSIGIVTLADQSVLDVKLAALEREGRAELISTPSLFTGNLQTASIEAGEEVPYQEISESGGTAVTFKKAVLGLKVTPHILPCNKVLLRLQINQDRPSNKMILGVPTISTRQITTNVLARTNQTIVLGGIYETNQENGFKGVPYLSRVPFLGLLFRSNNTRNNKRELLIFVTPRLT